MCVILHLPKGVMPEKNKFKNAVYNNWHSYGLVTKVDDKLDIKKKVPKSGEVDPEEVWKLLEADKNHERFLHLRHTTVGETNLENAHPFDVYYDPKTGRQVVFMHNGTMYEYRPKKWDKDKKTFVNDETSNDSDTKVFVEEILIPYISSMDFGKGTGDIEHFNVKRLIRKFFPPNNRGVLISSDQTPLFLDTWKDQGTGKNKYSASNDTYFDVVQRGPEFERRAEKKLKENKVKNHGVFTLNMEQLKDFQLEQKHPFYQLSESPCMLVNDWEVYNREGATLVGYFDLEELVQLYEDKEACLALMGWVFSDYSQLFDEYNELEKTNKKLLDKLNKASLRIEELVTEKKVG